ncbi:Dabb family protein [Streptomyces sp. NPDC004244]|uniref:Dabb family protein n=1 Tax=Streptomyces sp. NPDC101206 TaxID=3366128 RepID=UPI0037F764B3
MRGLITDGPHSQAIAVMRERVSLPPRGLHEWVDLLGHRVKSLHVEIHMTAKRRPAAIRFLVASTASVVAVAGCSMERNETSGGGASAAAASTPAPAEQVDKAAAKALHEELSQVGPAKFTAADYKPGTVRHIVLLKFRPDAPPEKQAETMRRFRSLLTQAQRDGKPYIASLDSGVQTSGEEAGKGMKQGYVLTFTSEGDRNYYVGKPVVTDPEFFDPAHESFKNFARPLLDGAIVFDFNASR